MWLGSGIAVAVIYRLAAAALIPPLAWELPCATGVAIKRKKKKKRKKERKEKNTVRKTRDILLLFPFYK